MEKFKEMFTEYVRAGLVIGWSLYTMALILIVILYKIPAENQNNAGMALGFVFGVLTGGTGVYFSINPSGKKPTQVNVEENTGDIHTETIKKD